MTINYQKKTILLTKKFAAAASKFGSDEYKQLRDAKNDYPTFAVVINKPSKTQKGEFKGLTYKYMVAYIEKHDNEEKTIMKSFIELRGKSEEAKELMAGSANYFEIRSWFFEQFPEIKAFAEKREKLLVKKTA